MFVLFYDTKRNDNIWDDDQFEKKDRKIVQYQNLRLSANILSTLLIICEVK